MHNALLSGLLLTEQAPSPCLDGLSEDRQDRPWPLFVVKGLDTRLNVSRAVELISGDCGFWVSLNVIE
jgi:hypothetical protein